ncbi:MAG: sensor histidine kinase [Pseudomonas sp.]|uniref:sensor histidine kinase n=1 Tax=Pseudomonas sp. TaxID=306 RepID=UPI003D0D60F8
MRRNLLMLFVPWAVLIVLLTALLYERLLDARLEPLLRDQQNSINEGIGVLNRHLSALRGHVKFLANQPLLARVLQNPTPENIQALALLFQEFSDSTDSYDRIRWLDEHGNEQVRVDWHEGRAWIRDRAQLQNKAERYFFVETMNLAAGEYYLSRFDLSLDYGAIEEPHKPTLRGATPVFDEAGERRGIVLLNYLGSTLLNRLRQVSQAYGGNLALVDHEGYWLLGEQPDDAWGFMLNRPDATLASRYPEGWKLMVAQGAGVFSDRSGYWSYTHFDPHERNGDGAGADGRWLLVAHLPYEQVQGLRFEVIWQVLLFGCVMLALGLVVVVRLALAERARDQVQRQLELSGEELQRSNADLKVSVDQLQRTRGALLQAEKLSSLGTLVAGVAHELNTPIGAASVAASTLDKGNRELQQGFREGLQRSMLERFLQRNDEGLAIILGNLTRMAQLTRAFKQLASDRASTERRTFDLIELVREVLLVFTPKLKQTPHQVDLLMPDKLILDSYPGPLGQILQNLIDNALIHAFEPGFHGVVTVKIERDLSRHSCLIEVADNGAGMTEEVLVRIFDPFFTTKRGRGGTGLGLHITHQLAVEVLGADLQVISAPGQGTRFRLQLSIGE